MGHAGRSHRPKPLWGGEIALAVIVDELGAVATGRRARCAVV